MDDAGRATDQFESDRRTVVIVAVALFASLALYAFLGLFLAGRATSGSPGKGNWLFLPLAAAGSFGYVAIAYTARSTLRSQRGSAANRVRSNFVMRMAAAEAIGIIGLVVALTGAERSRVLALFGISAIALAASAPTRHAWRNALETAGAA